MSHQETSVQLGLGSKVFNPFEMNEDEHEILDYEIDLDPDKCYSNQYSHSLIKNCNYFLEESFKKHLSYHHISNEAFSMLHLNIRSIPANLPAFQSYLDILDHHFSIIGLTETWLKPSNISAYGIGGYNRVGITRQNTKGGGIALFISQEIVYSKMTDLCMVTDYLECLFVKVNTNGSSYVVGVVYRPPNTNITLFNEK